jgi:di/tricarboxylate transporter
VGHRLLPERSVEETSFEEDLQAYLFEIDVGREAAGEAAGVAGLTVEEAALRDLDGAFLAHLEREGHVLTVTPETMLLRGDTLTFHGSSSALEALLKRPGLERSISMPASEHNTLPLFEAVVAPSSRLVGKTLPEASFRDAFGGVVLGLHRRDEHAGGSLDRMDLRSGDLLLVEAPDGFAERWGQDHREFYVVAPRRAEREQRSGKAPLALGVLAAIVLAALAGVAPIAAAAFLGALAVVALRCISVQEAAAAIDVPVLTIIAAALGLGRAVEKTGVADLLGTVLVDGGSTLGAVGVLAALYLATSFLTELITNNGAAALMVGIATSAATQVGAPPKAFALAVALAASASFMTPIGYQTNLMVMAPGGYRFSDYAKAGVVVDAIVGIVVVGMISAFYL